MKYDIFIIGGGINGVGIARDAAGRGLKIGLCEKGDLASQTSSWSTKLIHGGIRYLENYQFKLVRESLKEREIINNIASHITKPIRFVMPHVKSIRPIWIIRLGLLFYDFLGGVITLPKSKFVYLDKDYNDNPIKSDFKIGYEYSDLQIDDSRLVLINAQDAIFKGADFFLNTEVIDAKRVKDYWKIKLNNNQIKYSKTLVNASGPWAVNTLKNICNIDTKKTLRLVQGSHIIINKNYKGEQAYILQQPDKRIVFIIPYLEKYLLIGTTDKEVENFENPKITNEEIEYLLNACNIFLKKKISRNEIVFSYSGIRSLVNDFNVKVSKITRDYEFDINDKGPVILTIFGGKLTTYRKLAEHVLEKLSKYILIDKKSWTSKKNLPGSQINNDKINIELPAELSKRLNSTYGSNLINVIKYIDLLNGLGEKISDELYEFEVIYLIKEEYAKNSEDILFRRTKLGICFSKNSLQKLDKIINRYVNN